MNLDEVMQAVQVKILRIEPGDILVLKMDVLPSPDVLSLMRDRLREVLNRAGLDNECIVVHRGEVEIIRPLEDSSQ